MMIHLQLFVLILLGTISDIKHSRIKNSLIIFFIITGVSFNMAQIGLEGLQISLGGILIPLLLLPLFIIGAMGAGDIKFFCAIGAIMGMEFVSTTMLYAFPAGGIMALVLMLIRKNGKQRIQYFWTYITWCFLTASLQRYNASRNCSGDEKFPFACATACGTIIALYL